MESASTFIQLVVKVGRQSHGQSAPPLECRGLNLLPLLPGAVLSTALRKMGSKMTLAKPKCRVSILLLNNGIVLSRQGVNRLAGFCTLVCDEPY